MMIRQTTTRATCRAGITLTEILIGIMILGVGLVSLATLFPIGLLRLREAQRNTRSALLAYSAEADLSARGLLNKVSFLNPYLSPWYVSTGGVGPGPAAPMRYDPWIQDTPGYGEAWWGGPSGIGVYRGMGGTGTPLANTQVGINGIPQVPGPGLPVAYDPLWRYHTGIYADPTTTPEGEARFGNGLGFVGLWAGVTPSAHGLQRITNFNPLLPIANSVPGTFVSPEDMVWQEPTSSSYWDTALGLSMTNQGQFSPVVPDMGLVAPDALGNPRTTQDWRFTWMFTGQQSDSADGTYFDGDLVVFENRQFGIAAVTTPAGGSAYQVAGETVVEAVFGYGRVLATGVAGPSARRTVLLRWPAGVPDPEIKVGNWIADVTYERTVAGMATNFPTNIPGFTYPAQRCYWYQVAKVNPAADCAGTAYDFGGSGYRYMIVYVGSDLQAKTLLTPGAGGNPTPAQINAALICPSVVNVFPMSITASR